jgi:hypothetical protein
MAQFGGQDFEAVIQMNFIAKFLFIRNSEDRSSEKC